MQVLGRTREAWRRSLREELALPVDRPLIATGHQPVMPHPGVLVKSMLVSVLAESARVAVADLVVDQDVLAYDELIAYPGVAGESDVRSNGEQVGTLGRFFLPLGPVLPEVTALDHPPVSLPVPGGRIAEPLAGEVAEGVHVIIDALKRHEQAPDAAAQWVRAQDDLRAPHVAPMPRPSASALLSTGFGHAILKEMARDPWRCAEAFNAALREIPGSGIRPLLLRDDLAELPLWRIRSVPRSPIPLRERAFDGDALWAADDPEHRAGLRPRALLLTAIMRLAGCDLFVHGTGGGAYDRVMEAWVGRWLGVRVAPAVTATVTRRLHLPERGGISIAEARARTLEARRAWHDPESWSDERAAQAFGAGAPGETKRRMLEAIRTVEDPRERRETFRAMHRQLETLRGLHVGAVERRNRIAAEARRRAGEEVILSRRDWPFPLYGHAAMERLSEEVRMLVYEAGGRTIGAI